jgi:hypothetical protein
LLLEIDAQAIQTASLEGVTLKLELISAWEMRGVKNVLTIDTAMLVYSDTDQKEQQMAAVRQSHTWENLAADPKDVHLDICAQITHVSH